MTRDLRTKPKSICTGQGAIMAAQTPDIPAAAASSTPTVEDLLRRIQTLEARLRSVEGQADEEMGRRLDGVDTKLANMEASLLEHGQKLASMGASLQMLQEELSGGQVSRVNVSSGEQHSVGGAFR